MQTQQTTAFRPGDLVEAIGFPALGEYNPVLQDAMLRRIGSGPVPQPVSITAEDVLDHDGDLVELQADVLSLSTTKSGQWLGMRSGSRVFGEEVDQAAAVNLPPLREGSRVRVTGICGIEVGGMNEPSSFRMLLRSGADLRVLRQPSWWTLTRIRRLLVLLGLAILAALTWAAMLRQRVTAQTKQLVHSHRDMEKALAAARDAT